MAEPRRGVATARPNDRRAVQVEYRHPGRSNQPPSAISRSRISRLAGSPCHLLDRAILVQPRTRLHPAYGRNAGIDARGWPNLSRRHENVSMLDHVGVKILKLNAVCWIATSSRLLARRCVEVFRNASAPSSRNCHSHRAGHGAAPASWRFQHVCLAS